MKVAAIIPADIFEMMLLEANIVNIKDEYQGVSIAGYLKQFLENLPGQQLQQTFLKKITNLLINDERFHYAVRELPPDAPEWAKKAVAAQQLYAFKSTPELDDTLQHITHFLAAAAEDAEKSPSPDQRVVAQRELGDLAKVENLDVLKKKADAFFTRGSRKAGREVTGMEQVFDAGEGYIWYKLTDEGAFRREGKVLQNCIGTHWTKAKTDKQGQIIVVMKNPSNESVVAARITENGRMLHEVKGKNNRPPIDKYMPPTIKFINKMKIDPSGAMYDLRNAGYYYDQEKKELLSKPEAIKRFVKTRPIADVGGGLTLVQSTVQQKDLFGDLYGNSMAGGRYGYYHGDLPNVYEFRDKSNNPVVTAIVNDKTLAAVAKHAAQPVQESTHEPLTIKMVKELLKRGLVTDIAEDLQRSLVWKDKQIWDKKQKDFKELSASEDIETDKTHMKWKVYTDRDTIEQLLKTLQRRRSSYDDSPDLGAMKPSKVKQIYVDTRTDTLRDEDDDEDVQLTHVIIQTTDGKIIPVRAVFRGGTFYVSNEYMGFKGTDRYSRGERDDRAVNSIVGLANRANLELPKSVQIHHGIVHNEDGKYQRFEPKFEQLKGEIPAVKLDLSKLSPGDRLAALAYISSSPKYADVEVQRGDSLSIADTVAQIKTGKSYSPSLSDTDTWGKNELQQVYDTMFSGGTPEMLYVADVKYGTNQKARVTMIADGKKIVRIDSKTAKESWQKWDDLDKVADQLNRFAKENNLTFAPNALVPFLTKGVRSADHPGEFRITDGKMTTAAREKEKEIEAKRAKGHYAMEGTDTLTFKDGTKFERMSATDQANWVRQDMRGEGGRGEAWKIYDSKGEPAAILIVDRGNIMSMYGKGYQDKLSARGVVFNLLPYVKQAAQTFGWKKDTGRSLNMKPGGKLHAQLKDYNRRMVVRRDYLRDVDKFLVAMGALTGSSIGASGRRKQYSVSQRGKDVLKELEKGKAVNILDYMTAADLPEDFVPPTRREAPKRERAGGKVGTGKWKVSTAAPRTGTKAEEALARFRQMTADQGRVPTRGEFIQVLTQAPFNMSNAGAQTYYYTTKAKYSALGEAFSAQAAKELREDPLLHSFRAFLIG